MSRIRVLLADDCTVIRIGLRTLLEAQPDIEVVADTADGTEALQRAVELRPTVAVLGFSLRGLNGTEVTVRLRTEAPEVKVLILSAYEDHSFVTQVLRAGAQGYIPKRANPEELVHAVRAIAAGEMYLEPTLAAQLAGASKGSDGADTAPMTLSERERGVLHLLAVGYTNKEIAARMKISVKTVETYKTRGMEKLDLQSRVDVVRYACQKGWLNDV